jgi:hypothetical protein
MANTLTNLFETLVLPAMAELQSPLMLRNSMMKKIYVQRQPVAGRVGRTINVNIPIVNEGDVIDIGNGPIQVTDQDHTSVSLVVNNNKSKAFRVPEFDQGLTPVELSELYMQPAIESVTRKINRSICSLVNTTNFNVHTSITGGADTFSRANIGTAWSNLVGIGVPMVPGKVHFVTGHVPYANMISDTSYIQESIVGITAAEAAQQTARLMPAYQALIDYDPLFPQPSAGATYAGLFFNSNAIAYVPVALPAGNKQHVRETYYTPDGTGLTYRIQVWYDPREQAWIMHIHAAYALAVVRPNYGSYLVST